MSKKVHTQPKNNIVYIYMYIFFRSQNLEEKCSTVEGLLSLSDEKVKAMLENYADGQEESRRLIAALKHLQAYTGIIVTGKFSYSTF